MIPPNDFKNRPDELKPREQMRAASDLRTMPSESLLAILLKTGAPGCDVVELARRLISAYGSLHNLVRADWRSLGEKIRRHNRDWPQRKILGIGDVKQMELAAAFELVRRGYEAQPDDIRECRIADPDEAYRILKPLVAYGDEQENFYVLPLNLQRHPLSEPIRVTRGTASSSLVHAREMFREAIRWGAYCVMVAHNHPSGDPTPSEGDFETTRQLLRMSRDLGIPLLDHLVLGAPGSNGGKGYVSIRSLGGVTF